MLEAENARYTVQCEELGRELEIFKAGKYEAKKKEARHLAKQLETVMKKLEKKHARVQTLKGEVQLREETITQLNAQIVLICEVRSLCVIIFDPYNKRNM
jgi:peptidoglycan hydrolase CwlO-like protein